jgi:hypothetical protein
MLAKMTLKAPYFLPYAILNDEEEVDDLSYHTAIKYGGMEHLMQPF